MLQPVKENKIEKLKKGNCYATKNAELKNIYNGFWNFCKQKNSEGKRGAHIWVISKRCNLKVSDALGCYPSESYTVITDNDVKLFADAIKNYFCEHDFSPSTSCYHTGEERCNINFSWDS